MSRSIHSFWLSLRERGESGTVLTMVAVSLPVLMLASGIAVDFSRAASLRTTLNSAADAAALVALTPTMMQQPTSIAAKAATNVFTSQTSSLDGLVQGSLTMTVSFPMPTNPLDRIVTVTYTAQSENFFGGLEPASVFSIGGVSTAQSSLPPNIDLYMLLDNSPSMSLPSTSAGLNTMWNATPQQGGGCSFACHNANVNYNGDTSGNLCLKGATYTNPTLDSPPPSTAWGSNYCAPSQGTQLDNYAMARHLNVPLRLDAVGAGVSALMADAKTYSSSGIYSTPPSYRFAAYSIDSLWNVPSSNNLLMGLTANYTSAWSAASASFGVMEMWNDGWSCANPACSSHAPSGIGPATFFDTALSSILATMPTPGGGTNIAGDSPKEVLFFVTDGLEDKLVNGSSVIQSLNANGAHNYCNDIKAKGIKIAILYTEYLPIPSSWYYDDYVAPFQPQIGPALQACASPGLFYDASIDTNLSQATQTLFQQAVQTTTLTQ